MLVNKSVKIKFVLVNVVDLICDLEKQERFMEGSGWKVPVLYYEIADAYVLSDVVIKKEKNQCCMKNKEVIVISSKIS